MAQKPSGPYTACHTSKGAAPFLYGVDGPGVERDTPAGRVLLA